MIFSRYPGVLLLVCASLGACGNSSDGGTDPGASEAAGAAGSTAGAAGSAAGAAGSAGGVAGSGAGGAGGGSGCAPKAKIIACWVGDAASPPGPGTHSLARCREYTGDDGSGPHQWDASCVPDSTTHAIDACPAGFTSRCVASCGKPQEYVDYNYDGGGSSLICQGSGGVWLQP
jgi:hypothetical protein